MGYNRPGASVLQEASLPVAQQDTCRNHMRYWGTVTSKMVCVSRTIVINCYCYVKGEMIMRQTNASYRVLGS